jgi:hypothetical protein
MTPAPIASGRAIVIAKGFGEQQFDWTDGIDEVFQLQPAASLRIQVKIDKSPKTAIEFSLTDERRQATFQSGKLQFNDGNALWDIPEILPGQYKLVATGTGNVEYALVADDDDRSIPEVIELSEAGAFELKLLMERK